jgi:hypothetical protein
MSSNQDEVEALKSKIARLEAEKEMGRAVPEGLVLDGGPAPIPFQYIPEKSQGSYSSGRIQIVVKLVTEFHGPEIPNITLDVKGSDTIASVKEKVRSNVRILPSWEWRDLRFGGKEVSGYFVLVCTLLVCYPCCRSVQLA